MSDLALNILSVVLVFCDSDGPCGCPCGGPRGGGPGCPRGGGTGCPRGAVRDAISFPLKIFIGDVDKK